MFYPPLPPRDPRGQNLHLISSDAPVVFAQGRPVSGDAAWFRRDFGDLDLRAVETPRRRKSIRWYQPLFSALLGLRPRP